MASARYVHEDPASARIGESFWQFWPRTVLGSLKSAWRLEARIRHRGQMAGLSPMSACRVERISPSDTR